MLGPTNDALAALLASPDAPNINDRTLIANPINYHLINGTITSDRIPSDGLGAIFSRFFVNDNIALLNGSPQFVSLVSNNDGVTV